ncbi:MAG: GNAT family N-acetyltransferase [Deltaproteobacteria bacterium]|nr:GNAT family N-acetyltransferase [Deltaproteobacteria bacterium]
MLRRPIDSDRRAWSELVVASRDFLERWIQVPDIGDDPDGRAWFDATLARVGDERFEKLLVFLRDGEVLVGALNFNEIVRGSFHSAYLGYWIGAEHSGRGLMTEALGLALTHGFEVLNLHRVEANLQPDNAASRALVRKWGFVKEGFSERYLWIGGQWRDHERWALTVERWNGLGR